METRGKKPTKANLEAKKSQGGVREKPTSTGRKANLGARNS
jgi:hypothetical protein